MKTTQLGIELGSRHLRIAATKKKEFLKIKNMIAFDEDDKVKAIGDEAFDMYEKQPYSVRVIKPMEHGVISDYTNMRYLLGTVLDGYFKRVHKPELVIAVPVDITNVEKRAFDDLAWEAAGKVKDIKLIEKPILAAIGSGIDVEAPCGNMIIDIGAGTTEISVISLGGIVESRLLPYAENETQQDISVKGRDIVSGLPKEVKIPAAIVEEKARDQIREICMQAKAVLEVVTPELATDIVNEGIYISGGACGFTKTEEWIKEELKVTVHIKPEPQDHVILGMQSYLK